MKKGVTSEVISEVRGRAGILEVVSEFVPLKRAGKHHKGLCPFHKEKTPSFIVNTEKGIFKCFGCGEGGDVFAFVQKVRGLDFLDTVRELAGRYGVALVETEHDRKAYDKRSQLLMLYEQACQYYRRILEAPEEGAVVRDYLESRGISFDTARQFRIGYAPNTWDGLLNYLTATHKVSPDTLEEAGLVRRKAETRRFYDLFRDRLMVPISDDQGRVIAFGGRTLGASDIKYINSPESPIYTKGQHLYAFHLAREAIKEADSVIVAEGYFDAIACHQFGIKNAVATLGTALTERQSKQLVRYTESKRVYLAFDSDSAGQKAVERGVETLSQVAQGIGIELRVIRVPGGKDPDECLRGAGEDAGPEAFAKAVETAQLLIDWQLEEATAGISLKSHTGKIDAAKKLVPILAQIKNAVDRGEYIRQWSSRLGIREEELLSDVRQTRRRTGLGYPVHSSPPKAARARLASGHLEAERQLLALFLTDRDDYARVKDVLDEGTFIEPAHQRIRQAIEGVGTQFETTDDLQVKLQDRLALDPEAAKAFNEIIWKSDEMRKQNAPPEIILVEGRSRILVERLDQAMNEINSSMQGKTDEEQEILQSKINSLRRLKETVRSEIKTGDALDEVKGKIDRLLGEDSRHAETTA